ncbi:hypothetical protein K1719_008660 [Acacia pycnantha]|nr:hypothetical protein K1719_008660 [Acacia pycnantha]
MLSTAVDLESVEVNEIGHLLGLGHSSVEEAIMYSTISSRTRKMTLADDGIQGIQQLYGSNPNYNGHKALMEVDVKIDRNNTVLCKPRFNLS